MLLGIELTRSQKVVDLSSVYGTTKLPLETTHDLIVDLQELTLHLILPPPVPQLRADGKDHIDSPRDQTRRLVRLHVSRDRAMMWVTYLTTLHRP
jgi:hypothetical protein